MPYGQVLGKFHRSLVARTSRDRRRSRHGARVHQPLDGRPQVVGGEVGVPLDHSQGALLDALA